MAVASVVITILIGLVTFLITCRYVLFPFLFAQLSNLRVSAISFLSLKGLEYRPKGEHGSVIPTLRVERAGWAWGGLKDSEVGVIVLRIDKVVFRVKKRRKSAPHDGPEKPAKVKPIKFWNVEMADLHSLRVASHNGETDPSHLSSIFSSTTTPPSPDSSLSRSSTSGLSLTTWEGSS